AARTTPGAAAAPSWACSPDGSNAPPSGSVAPDGKSASMTRDLPCVARPFEGERLQSLLGVDPCAARPSRPDPVAVERPGEPVVGQADVDDLVEPARERGVGH